MFALLLFAAPLDLSTLERDSGVSVVGTRATLTGLPWTFLRTKASARAGVAEAGFTILSPAKAFAYFGASWSVWPDKRFADQGYDFGIELGGGYRVQFSHRHQHVALVRFPDGGILRVVPAKVDVDRLHRARLTVAGNRIDVELDGKRLIRYLDPLPTPPGGPTAFGTSSGAKIELRDLSLSDTPLDAIDVPVHEPTFSARAFLGNRPWLFDGDEPILMLPTPDSTYINNVKLRPGHRPMLSWNAHWDIANQGAYKAGANVLGEVKTIGGGKSISSSWTCRHVKDRFVIRTTLTAGWDAKRQAYTYDVKSDLEVLAGAPFEFRYGYDFEHHTPLDPFQWQYLVGRKKGGALYHRPVYPIDPGPQEDLQTDGGLRMWYGRHDGDMPLAPAVEYSIGTERKLNTAVCAAFYDTGVSFPAETAKAGTKVTVAYRYTGYPPAEAREKFAESTIYPSARLDPGHHYVFAESWPKVTFDKHVPMSATWIYGRRPFMSGHNARPTYQLVKTKAGDAMKVGPGSFGAATLPTPPDLAPGKYLLTAKYETDNVRGPGGRIELTVAAPKAGKGTAKHTHYLPTGTAPDKTTRFLFEVKERGSSLTLGLGNAGTGGVLFREVTFAPAADGPAANPTPAAWPASPKGAIADYRMEEGRGLHVFDHARGPFGMLELSSVGWERGALVFEDRDGRPPAFPRWGQMHTGYLSHPSYKGRDRVPAALAGFHGGAMPLAAFTLAARVAPTGSGDVIGLGARRVVLRLVGDKAPFRLQAALNVNDRFDTDKPLIGAGKWQHVAVTGERDGDAWRVRLYLDGKDVGGGTTKVLKGGLNLPPSLILGTELFYFHNSHYRGRIGRVVVFDRCLRPDEVGDLAK